VNAPFGLETDYDEAWYGRYHALKSAMKTININPSLSYEVNDKLAVGGGVSAQYIDVELSSAIDSAAACRSIASAANSGALLAQCLGALPTLANPATDSKAVIKGNDWSLNYNAGLLYKPTEKTKVGLSYRSEMKHNLEGTADYTINSTLQPVLAATGVTRFNDVAATADAALPASLSLSVAHKLNDKVEVLGDITRTQWSSFERLTVKNADTGAVISDVDESWQDVNRYAAGLNYQYNDRLKLRTGVAFDEEPIPDAKHRTARIPGNDRTWVSAGANYKLKKNLDMDVGYSHLFLDETPIDNTDDATGYALRGNYDSNVDIISAQLNWSF
jgi:long-chain fatty acid transport protein